MALYIVEGTITNLGEISNTWEAMLATVFFSQALHFLPFGQLLFSLTSGGSGIIAVVALAFSLDRRNFAWRFIHCRLRIVLPGLYSDSLTHPLL